MAAFLSLSQSVVLRRSHVSASPSVQSAKAVDDNQGTDKKSARGRVMETTRLPQLAAKTPRSASTDGSPRTAPAQQAAADVMSPRVTKSIGFGVDGGALLVSPRTFTTKQVKTSARPPIPHLPIKGIASTAPAQATTFVVNVEASVGDSASPTEPQQVSPPVNATTQQFVLPTTRTNITITTRDPEFVAIDASKFPLEQYVTVTGRWCTVTSQRLLWCVCTAGLTTTRLRRCHNPVG